MLIVVPVVVGGLLDVPHFIAGENKAGLSLMLGLFVGIAMFVSLAFIDLVRRRADNGK